MSIGAPRARLMSPGRRAGASWWRRAWIAPLAALVVAALVYIWAYYITFDPRTATVDLPADQPLKYPVVLAHIVFGTVAMTTVVLQVWPWFRRRHPQAHRWAGWLYVVGGVAPSAALAAVLLPTLAAPTWFALASRVTLEVLWVATTALGVVAGRRRNYIAHRWFMLSSFALTMDAVSSRLVKVVLTPLYPDVIGATTFLLIVGWGGWLLNLVGVQLWLLRGAWRLRRADRRSAAATAPGPAPTPAARTTAGSA
ncbi:DUF2306 domain-containing protein [Actinomycetospora atypica]|uniref:DUF2306 domain-containing protein n=1 Tax=Actinomycetospora atypica TaxID=1290095 RepID=A0ABV9YMZ3_9PSEU